MRQRSKHRDPGLSAAIETAGTLPRLVELLVSAGVRITPSAVYQWPRVPVNRCAEVERVTGVSRYRLRPDIFGEDPKAKGKRQKTSAQETQRVA